MKLTQYFLALTLLLLGGLNANIQAQDLRSESPAVQTFEPPSDPRVANILPPKQVTLLYEVQNMEEEIEEVDAEAENSFEEASFANQEFKLNVLLHLFSIANLAYIQVKVGSQPGQSDIAYQRFAFDQSTGLAAPFSYARDGKTIVLGLGTVKGVNSYYAEVVLEGQNGQRSEARLSRMD